MHGLIAKIHQSIHIFSGYQINTAAIPAIPAVWAAERNIFFPAKGRFAIPAVACFYSDYRFVNKSHNVPIKTKKPR
jgi:hypothetical protein